MDPATGYIVAQALGAGLGIWGQDKANKTNQQIAREQMAFQRDMAYSAQSFSERMANTAVQRAVADYKAAGLNPALAYERSGASPVGVTAGGSQARVENIMRDAPNLAATAMQLRQMKQALEIGEENKDLLAAQRKKAIQEASESSTRQKLLDQDYAFKADFQPHDLRRRVLENQMLNLEIPGLTNIRDMEERMGQMSPSMRLFIEFMKGISGMGSAAISRRR